MRVSIGQIYVKPGVEFPFSSRMQRWLGEELSSVAGSSTEFTKKFGPDFNLMIRISADALISDNVIKGPTVFKKDKSVEFTVFLPYSIIAQAFEGCRVALEFLLAGIRIVYQQAGVGTVKLDGKIEFLIESICSDSTMLKKPWSGAAAGSDKGKLSK